ncbi:hypothetical protein GCM10022288_15840 [Gryllotalpicola kribbensis]|uniref:Uncharacterized protein n=1 Tax=Gryllotalpicola kribbensis TaxID=993084 RepID=A0ABP8ARM4_9MICO
MITLAVGIRRTREDQAQFGDIVIVDDDGSFSAPAGWKSIIDRRLRGRARIDGQTVVEAIRAIADRQHTLVHEVV